MIIRLLHLKVHPGRQTEFKRVLELLIPYSIKTISGMVALYPGQLQGPNSQDFVLVTVWKDQASMMSQTRRNWIEAVLPPEVFTVGGRMACVKI